MKKNLLIIAVIGVVVLSLGMTSQAFAQNPDPAIPSEGRRGNRSIGTDGVGVPLEMNINLDGTLEELLHGYMAVEIGVDPSVLADGNFTEIALVEGFDLTEIRAIVLQAHSDALDQALVDGLVTQEEYDWLSVRGFITRADGNHSGMEIGMGSRMGTGTGTCLEDGTPLADCTSLFDGTSQSRGYRGGK
jgi:hypothetical protein